MYESLPAIIHVMQPTRKSCGHAVLSMITGEFIIPIIALIGNRATWSKDLRGYLNDRGYVTSSFKRFRQYDGPNTLPDMTVLLLRGKKPNGGVWGHWVLKVGTHIYDPRRTSIYTWEKYSKRHMKGAKFTSYFGVFGREQQ